MTTRTQELLEELKAARGSLPAHERRMEVSRKETPLDPLLLKALSSNSPSPKKVLFVRSDSFGDLVLFAPALAWLRAHWPDSQIGVLLKTSHREVIPLLPDGIVAVSVEGDPNSQSLPDALIAAAFEEKVRAFGPDLLVAPSFEKTWFHALAAKGAASARRVSVGPVRFDPAVTHFIEQGGGTKVSDLYPESVTVDRDAHELEKSRNLLSFLAGIDVPPLVPGIRIPEASRAEAKSVLRTLKLSPNEFVICNPAGIANVAIKRWSASNFSKVIRAVTKKFEFQVLVTAHESEKAVVDQLLEKIGESKRVKVWLGRDGQLPLLAALAESARFYLGNDTSTLHIAEGAQTPVIGIYGGGTWPRFKPSLGASTCLLNPLPCFGCGWDCHLGDAPCIKLVEPEDAIEAIGEFLEGKRSKAAAGSRTVELERWSSDILKRIKASREIHERISHESRHRQLQLLANQDLLRDAEQKRLTLDDTRNQLKVLQTRFDAEGKALREQLEKVSNLYKATEADSNLRLQQIQKLTELAHSQEADAVALRRQIQALNEAIQERQKDHAAHEHQVLVREQRIAALESQLQSESKAAEHRHREELESLAAKLAFTEKDSGQRFEQIQTLAALVHKQEAEGVELRRQIQVLNDAARQSEHQLAALEAQASAQKQQLLDANSKMAVLSRESSEIQNGLAIRNEELVRRTQQLEAELASGKASFDELRGAISTLAEDTKQKAVQIASLEGLLLAANQSLSAANAHASTASEALQHKIQNLEAENAAKQALAERLHGSEKALEAVIAQKQSELVEITSHFQAQEQRQKAEIAELTGRFEEISKRLQATEKDSSLRLDQIHTLTSLVNSQKSEAIELRRQIDELNAVARAASSQTYDLQVQLGEISVRAAECEALEIRLQKAVAEGLENAKQLDSIRLTLMQSESENGRLSSEMEVIRMQRDDLVAKNERLASELESVKNEATLLAASLADRERVIERVGLQLESIESESAAARVAADGRVAALEQQLATANSTIKECEQRFTQTTDQLRQEINRLTSDLHSRQTALDELNSLVSRMTDERQRTANERAVDLQRIDVLSAEALRAKAERQAAIDRLTRFIQIHSQSTSQLAELENSPWTRVGKTLGLMPTILVETGADISAASAAPNTGTLGGTDEATLSKLDAATSEIVRFRAENERLGKENSILRTVTATSLDKDSGLAPALHPGVTVLPRTRVQGDQLFFAFDKLEDSGDTVGISGWFFSPEIDCAESIRWVWLCTDLEQRLVPTRPVVRSDVKLHHLPLDLGPQMPLGDPRRANLDQSGFTARIPKSSLIPGSSYRVEIQVEGPQFSVRRATPNVIDA